MSDTEKKPVKRSFVMRIAVLAIAGVLLIVLGNALLSQRKQETTTRTTSVTAAEEMETYKEALQAEIVQLCSSVSGVGGVTAVVSLSGGYTYEYATDYKSQTGGSSTESYVTIGSGSGETPIYLSVKPPGIAGIGIVCNGGGEASVCRELIALLSATYGIGANKIYVTASTPRSVGISGE